MAGFLFPGIDGKVNKEAALTIYLGLYVVAA